MGIPAIDTTFDDTKPNRRISKQRIAGVQFRVPGEVPVGGPEFPHTMQPAHRGYTCIMYLGPADPCTCKKFPQNRPVRF